MDNTASVKQLRQLIRSLSRPLKPIPPNKSICPSTSLSIRPRAVIFDVYGTILISAAGDIGHDAAQDSEKAFWQALELSGLIDAGFAAGSLDSEVRITEVLRDLIRQEHNRKKEAGIQYPEVDIVDIWQKLLAVLGLKVVSKEAVCSLALVYELRVNPVWPMPGLTKTLSTLQQRGVVLGIISNAQFYTPLILETLLETSLSELGFGNDLCIWSYKEGVAKPAVALFEKLQQRLAKYNISPQEVIYVGNDMLKDILPAMQIGWKTALFAGDRRSLRWREGDKRVVGLRPQVVINDLQQLSMCLDRL
ncbi:HAD family hydrolase [Desulfovulcanus sp.]